MTNAKAQFDVFLSHSSADKPTVEKLAQRLLAAGFKPWLDSWNLVPGDPWQEGLEEALDTCATCAVFLGPSGIGPWHNEELRVALDRRARDRTRRFRVIPVLLPGADPADPDTLPRFLSRMTWVDFRGGLDDAEAFRRLVAGIQGVAPGPGFATQPESSLQAVSNPALFTPGEQERLKAELARLQTQYDTWTRPIAALDTDIGRELDSERRLVLQERRVDLAAERDQILDKTLQVENQLTDGPQTPAATVAFRPNTSGAVAMTDLRSLALAAVQAAVATNPPPDDNLRRDIAANKVCAFVGAGLSIGAGLPGWYELMGELAGRIGQKMPPREWATAQGLITLAETYANSRGLFDLIVFLKDRLDTTVLPPTAAHLALARLPINIIFTANYDDLLERACRGVGKRVHVVVQDNELPFMRCDAGSINIIKLYGSLDRPDTIVLARQQYNSFFLKRPQMVKLLETHLGTSTMLYLGWGHTDPYFGLVFGEMQARFGELMPPGYAAMFDVSEAERLNLERQHIRLVNFPPGGVRTSQLAEWLEGLGVEESPPGGPTVRNASMGASSPPRPSMDIRVPK